MLDAILKEGAKVRVLSQKQVSSADRVQIVEALVKFKQPVFIYIIPHGELRGGAWVVLDPSINEEVMELYADTDARGGVLGK